MVSGWLLSSNIINACRRQEGDMCSADLRQHLNKVTGVWNKMRVSYDDRIFIFMRYECKS